MKLFKRSIWVLITGFFAIMLAIAFVGGMFARQYSANLNELLGINPYKIVKGDETDPSQTEYFSSDYKNADGTRDNRAMRAHSMQVSEQLASEGAVLLWNDNNALPLAKDSKVSLFGIATINYLVAGGGSGYVGINSSETIKSALEKKGMSVNEKLWNTYLHNKSSYGYEVYGQEVKDRVGDDNYWEYAVNEMPYNLLDTSDVSRYGDAAVMTITRYTSEDGDTDFKPSVNGDEHLDDCFLDLSKEENEVLTELVKLKQAGTVKKVILLINTSNSMQMKNISKLGIDACIWVGMGGSAYCMQIADLLSGDAVPSGRLTDTYAYDADSAPSVENSGDFTFTRSAGVPADDKMTHNTKYLVYQEGIYVGYRYYETRYEDLVLGGRHADGSAGIKAGTGSNWSYAQEVAYPFGYGLSYTSFSYSDFAVMPNGADYNVSVTVKNAGSTYSGREAVQIYLQKPYTDYDVENGIEKAAVELIGFGKTQILAPGAEETLTVTVKCEDFKTYDSNGKGTYILEKGSYYLAAGKNAHDALNNILAKKGYSKTEGMDADGDETLVHKIVLEADDFETYSKSSVTGNAIKNQFDNADINRYEGTSTQKITYLSRSNWQETYPSKVTLTCETPRMVADMQYGAAPVAQEGDEMPVYGKVTSPFGKLSLAMLIDMTYGDPNWEDLLNQMTWEEQNNLISYGYCAIAGVPSISAPMSGSKDGPAGIKSRIPDGLDSLMCFPSEMLMASSFDTELVREAGDAFGMEMLHAGTTGLYGPGAGIHRSAYSGRNFEYYSEDGFLSGKMFAAETTGLQSRGAIVFAKHMALNDQERNRYGVTVWANEQAIREIYLKAFEGGVVEGHANGIMTSHNRIGCVWAGKHAGMLTDILRGEWGFSGLTITDAAVSAHELDLNAIVNSLAAGQDLWMSGGNQHLLDSYKTNPTVCLALRQACHRILYTHLHSSAMNGISSNDKIIPVTPWWDSAISYATLAIAIATLICLLCMVYAFIVHSEWFRVSVYGYQGKTKHGAPKNDVYTKTEDVKHTGVTHVVGTASKTSHGKLSKGGAIFAAVCILVAVAVAFSAAVMPFITFPAHSDFGGEENGGGIEIDPTPHACTHTCPVCGGCMDATCTEEGCEKKCGDDKTGLYTFEAEDGRAELGAGKLGMPYVSQEPGAEEVYIGNFSTNLGSTITFRLKAAKATTASLIISVSKTERLSIFTNNVRVSVGENNIEGRPCNVFFEFGGESWVNFTDVYIGCVELAEGENVIKLEFITEDQGGYNINNIKLRSDEEISWMAPGQETDDSAWATQEFRTVVDGEMPTGFTLSGGGNVATDGGGCIGNLSGAKGARLTFKINSDKKVGYAMLYLNICKRISAYNFDMEFALTINDKAVKSSVRMPAGENEWSVPTPVRIGVISLEEGDNTISFEIISDNGDYGGNVWGITLKNDEQATLKYAETSAPEVPNDTDWHAQEFKTVIDGAIPTGFTYTEGKNVTVNAGAGGYVGNLSGESAKGIKLTFRIHSAETVESASLYLTIARRVVAYTFNDEFKLTVNGQEYKSNVAMPSGENQWETPIAVQITFISLIEGDNTIEIEIISDNSDWGNNIWGITLKTEKQVTLQYAAPSAANLIALPGKRTAETIGD